MSNKYSLALVGSFLAAGCVVVAAPPPAPAPAPPPATATATAPAEPPPAAAPDPVAVAKQAYQATVSAWSSHDAGKVTALYAPNAVREQLGPQGWSSATGRPSLEKSIAALLAAFPDLSFGASRVIQKGNQLSIEWVMAGTNGGSMSGRPATNKKMGVHGASLVWLAPNGLVERERVYVDDGTLQAQTTAGQKAVMARPAASAPTGEPEWIVAENSADTSHNVELVEKYYAAIEKKDNTTLASLLADSVVQSNYSFPGDITGKREVMNATAALIKAFSHIAIAPKPAVAAGRFVAIETLATGALARTPAKVGTVHGLDVVEIDGGKIVHTWGYGSSTESAHAFGQ